MGELQRNSLIAAERSVRGAARRRAQCALPGWERSATIPKISGLSPREPALENPSFALSPRGTSCQVGGS